MRAVLFPLLAGSAAATCGFNYEKINYDLNSLKSLSNINLKSYGSVGQDFTDGQQEPPASFAEYILQFCEPATVPDLSCKKRGTSSAFQVLYEPNEAGEPEAFDCYSLGSYNETQSPIELLEPGNPVGGLRMRYNGGTDCGDRGGRKIIIDVACSNEDTISPHENGASMQTVFMKEFEICEYTVEFKSPFACPSACVTGNEICFGNGICGAHDGTAECLCHTGYTGEFCEGLGSAAAGTTGWMAAIISLSILMILLGLLLAFMVYMWIKLRRLDVDPESYEKLSSKFNELGQIT